MLIRFTIENWMSFRERTSFSMIASRERQHQDRLHVLEKYKTKVLPIAAIYGGNASGKSNFIKALSFAQDFIIKGVLPDEYIPVQNFLLAAEEKEKPTFFAFEICIDAILYEYSFSITKKAVIEEQLVEIGSTSEKTLFSRQNGKIVFHTSLKSTKKQFQFLEFAFHGTRDNQLFLTNSVSQNVENFKPVYDWFRQTLVILGPESEMGLLGFGDELYEDGIEISEVSQLFSHLLEGLDTGITRLTAVEIPLGIDTLPDAVKAMMQKVLPENEITQIVIKEDVFIVWKHKGQLGIRKLVSYHLAADGKEIPFKMTQESDGTRRLIDLLPIFMIPHENIIKSVFVIDELDRSLHTLLTRKLLNSYLNSCRPQGKSQLIFTTHDLLLMDQDLLRRDEMYVTERDATGASTIISFNEYKDVRADKDLRKSYLQGRLGGIPKLLLNDMLSE